MWLKCLICSIFLIAINYCDIKYYKIKNFLVLPLIAAGLIIGIINGEILDCLYGMFIPLILFPLYALKMLGAGDVKALCSIGALLGRKHILYVVAFTFVAGGIIALIFMICNKNSKERFLYLFKYLRDCLFQRKILAYDFGGKNGYFRFSYAITAGTILTILNIYFQFV